MKDADLRAPYAEHLAGTAERSADDCPPVEALEALAHRAGPEDERLDVLDHVMACEACRREFEMLRAVAAAGRRARPRWQLPVSLAAAAVVVLGVALWQSPSANPSPDVVRGAGADVEVVAPVGAVTGDVTFVWRTVPDAVRYELEVTSPSGSVVYQATVRDTIHLLPETVALDPGTEYAWSVRAVIPGAAERRSATTTFVK